MDNSLLFIDWDDTLFPTSWIHSNDIALNKDKPTFKLLDKNISLLINQLVKYGRLIIVTNASYQWMKATIAVLPYTNKLLEQFKIKIVSARYFYQDKYDDMRMWKKYAFKDIVNQFLDDTKKQQIISIGDAMYEYDALIDLCDIDKSINRLLKTVRFVNSPSLIMLVDQLQVLTRSISKIHNINQFLDLYMRMNN